jgi:hypothetical protein
VLENGTFDFPTAKDAIISPLAKRLFKEDGTARCRDITVLQYLMN